MERFHLSERQAEDILEIRLRQLARLEAIKIEQELKGLREEAEKAGRDPGQPGQPAPPDGARDRGRCQDLRRRPAHADPGRETCRARSAVVDEPVTVVVSTKGWVRARTGHGHDPASFAFKAGDACTAPSSAARSTPCWCSATKGRVYSVPVSMPAGCTGRRPAGHDADRPGARHAAGGISSPGRRRPRCCWPARAATVSSPRSST
jgi:topoisomerase-4 subunit A